MFLFLSQRIVEPRGKRKSADEYERCFARLRADRIYSNHSIFRESSTLSFLIADIFYLQIWYLQVIYF